MRKLKIFVVCTVISLISIFGLTACFNDGSDQPGTGNEQTSTAANNTNNPTGTGNNNGTTGNGTNNGTNGTGNNMNGTGTNNGTNGTGNNMNGTGTNGMGNGSNYNDQETNTMGDSNIINGLGDVIDDGIDELQSGLDNITETGSKTDTNNGNNTRRR